MIFPYPSSSCACQFFILPSATTWAAANGAELAIKVKLKSGFE
jgi:hypothetical protein